MLDMMALRAIGMMAARQARQSVTADTSANDVIDFAALLTPWKAGPQTAGQVVVYNGYPYKTIQAHDSTATPDWTPEATPALFAPYHGTDAAHALPWRKPTHAGDAYNKGEYMIYTDGVLYECMQDATVWDPDTVPAAWRKIEVES